MNARNKSSLKSPNSPFFAVRSTDSRASQRENGNLGDFSRGFKKISRFPYDFRGKTVLDIGSSTGGFTEYALAAGAAKVIAVEKGTNQMKAPLRFDPRIELHEKTDIFEFPIPDTVDLIMADVSFVSLTKVLDYIRSQKYKGELLMMLKPQFEARPEQLNRGVVKNEKIRREIIRKFEEFLMRSGFAVLKKRDNNLAGKNGNLERFYLLKIS